MRRGKREIEPEPGETLFPLEDSVLSCLYTCFGYLKSGEGEKEIELVRERKDEKESMHVDRSATERMYTKGGLRLRERVRRIINNMLS